MGAFELKRYCYSIQISSIFPSQQGHRSRSHIQAKDFRTVRDLPEVPLQPLRLSREHGAQLSEPPISDSGSKTEQNHYPLDVKVRIQSDDSASLASSTSDAQYSADSSFACTPAYSSASKNSKSEEIVLCRVPFTTALINTFTTGDLSHGQSRRLILVAVVNVTE